MKNIYLIREPSTDQGTPGVLVCLDDSWACFSLEPPWRGNQPERSAIPAGKYPASFYFSHHFKKKMYGVHDVPGRSGIAIHSGNIAGDRNKGFLTHTFGCILLGRHRGLLFSQMAVLSSRSAISDFERLMAGHDFMLHIVRPTSPAPQARPRGRPGIKA